MFEAKLNSHGMIHASSSSLMRCSIIEFPTMPCL